jgi:hypothetical protein
MAMTLIDVLVSARDRLDRPENDFSWSTWRDQAAALEEIDRLIEKVRRARIPKLALDVLFAPTGPIQEVSISSGWATEFLAIAEKYDQAIAKEYRSWWRFW